MSGWDQLLRVECTVIGDCPAYVPGTWGAFLVVIDWHPVWVPIILFFVSLAPYEVIFLFFSLILTTMYWSNYGMRAALRDPSPTAGCGDEFQMPALASQQAVLLGMLIVLMLVYYNVYVSFTRRFMIEAYVVAAIYARVYIGFNTGAQLLAGAIAGLLAGYAWFLFLVLTVMPYVPMALTTRPVRFLGLCNNVCHAHGFAQVRYIRLHAERAHEAERRAWIELAADDGPPL